jgi:hypothetical protein
MNNKKSLAPFLGGMIKFPFFFMFILGAFANNAQELDHHMEVGVQAGMLSYTGDLSSGANINFRGPAVGAFYRHNYKNNITVFRLNLLVGQLTGSESSSGDPLPEDQNRGFSTMVTEISGIFEYNFFDFRSTTSHQQYPICPYLFGGLGFGTVFTDDSPAFLVIPLGAGVKFRVGDKLNMGVEVGARKSFTDKIDGVDNDSDFNSSSAQDWYYFSGLTFSYTRYFQKCPQKIKW